MIVFEYMIMVVSRESMGTFASILRDLSTIWEELSKYLSLQTVSDTHSCHQIVRKALRNKCDGH